MEIVKLLNTIDSSKIKNKEIIDAIENLKENNIDLSIFLTNNEQIKCSEFDVASFLQQAIIKLIDKKIPLSLCKNVYDQYAIIFVINILENKTQSSKLTKMFIDIISNSAKFDIYEKVVKNLRKSLDSKEIILEVFWLIPLFSNPTVLASCDYSKFIEENKKVFLKIPEYALGYEFYVTGNIPQMDKIAYKQYLVDGITGLSKIK